MACNCIYRSDMRMLSSDFINVLVVFILCFDNCYAYNNSLSFQIICNMLVHFVLKATSNQSLGANARIGFFLNFSFFFTITSFLPFCLTTLCVFILGRKRKEHRLRCKVKIKVSLIFPIKRRIYFFNECVIRVFHRCITKNPFLMQQKKKKKKGRVLYKKL